MSERLLGHATFTGLVFGWTETIMTRQDKDKIRSRRPLRAEMNEDTSTAKILSSTVLTHIVLDFFARGSL